VIPCTAEFPLFGNQRGYVGPSLREAEIAAPPRSGRFWTSLRRCTPPVAGTSGTHGIVRSAGVPSNIVNVDLSGSASSTCLRPLRDWMCLSFEQSGELLWRDDPLAPDHELLDRPPVGVVGEQHPDAIGPGPRGEGRSDNGQQRLAIAWDRTQYEQRDGLAGRALPCHEQAE